MPDEAAEKEGAQWYSRMRVASTKNGEGGLCFVERRGFVSPLHKICAPKMHQTVDATLGGNSEERLFGTTK